MMRKRQRRGQCNVITPDVAEAFRRYHELTPQREACNALQQRALRKGAKTGDYSEFHNRMEPCGASCLCAERRECRLTVWRAFRWPPWGGVDPFKVSLTSKWDGVDWDGVVGSIDCQTGMTEDEHGQAIELRRALLEAAGMDKVA